MSKILDNLRPTEVKELSDKLSFAIPGARFSEAFIKGRWDGRKRLFSSTTYQFPTGLCEDVRKILKNYKIKFEFDFRKPQIKQFDVDFEFPHPLRDYQIEASECLIGAVRGIMVMGTGGGKTLTALKVIQHYGVRSLFLVNTKEALYDTIRAAESCFPKEKIGILGDGKSKEGGLVTISTVASMYRKVCLGDIPTDTFDLIFLDEVHHVGSDSWMKVVKYFNAVYKYGMTGTAFRTDGSSMLLRAMTGPVCFNMPSIELQNKGHLAKSKIYFIDCDKPDYLDRPLEYRELYDEGIVNNEFRNKLVVELVRKYMGKSMLIVFEKLEHGDILFEMIKKIDKNAVLIEGKTKKREDLKLKFESGELKTVVASRIYNESADIPILEVVINASGGKSGISVLQRIGRALRNFDGKTKALIFDFFDSFNLQLENHSKERLKWIKKEKHDFKIIKSIKEVENEGTKNSAKRVEVGKQAVSGRLGKKAKSVSGDDIKGRKKHIQ